VIVFIVQAETIGADVGATGAKARESGEFSKDCESHVGDRSLVLIN